MFLAPDELTRLAEIAVYTATEKDGREAMPEDELQHIIDWADGVRLLSGLLDNVLAGNAFVRWNAEKNDVTFSLTPRGTSSAEDLVRSAGLKV